MRTFGKRRVRQKFPHSSQFNSSINSHYVWVQWRTQKIFIRVGFVQWHMVVIFVWCALFVTSYSCFQANVLAKFVDIMCIFFHTHSPYFVCHCTEYELSTLQVKISAENTLNATTPQFITAKMSGCVLKQGNKTHSPLRQSSL